MKNIINKTALGKKRAEGFTIIEVLIVLAIAGLIILIVFLAVPALQRNARNTTKRSDASKALGAVGEFVANKNGAIPIGTDIAALQTSANLSAGTTLHGTVPTTVALVPIVTGSQIMIGTGLTCNAATTWVTSANGAALTALNFQAAVAASGSTRAIVALYSIESTGGNTTVQCLTS